jgi:ribosomal protein S18 acetylase RimI-like enzyme
MKAEILKYIDIAERTGVFRSAEIDVLKEILREIKKNPKSHYTLLEREVGRDLLGFAIIGRTPMTEFAWDIYWLVVDPGCHRRGIAGRLLEDVESQVLRACDKVVLRVETSSRASYLPARNFYLKHGFVESGCINDFYADGDSLVIFTKRLEKSYS